MEALTRTHLAMYLPHGVEYMNGSGRMKLIGIATDEIDRILLCQYSSKDRNDKWADLIDSSGLNEYLDHDERKKLWNLRARRTVFSLSSQAMKLLLRPLSDMNKEITHKGEVFNPIDRLRRALVSDSYEHDDFDHDIHFLMRGDAYIGQFRNDLVTMLRSFHFDTDGLIKAGLAIDINTLTP